MLTFEIDALPLSLSRPSTPDYTGRFLLSAIQRPLLHFVDGALGKWGTAATASCSPCGRVWTLELSPLARWHDGDMVTAEDAIHGLVEAAAHPYWGRFLAILEAIEIGGTHQIQIRLRHGISYFAPLLSAIEIGPKRSKNANEPDRFYSGAYRLDECSNSEFVMMPNLHFPQAESRVPIRFVFNPDPALSLEGFSRGRWEVTSVTGVDPAYIKMLDLVGSFQRTGIYAQLEFSPTCALGQSRNLRQALHLATDRVSLGVEVGRGFEALSSFGPQCFPELAGHLLAAQDREEARRWWQQSQGPKQLRIAYNNYYPNTELLAACARMWEDALGISVALETYEFGADPPVSADASLQLRFPSFPHAWAVLDQLVRLAGLFEPRTALWPLATDWLREAGGEAGTSETLLAALASAMPVVPLGEIIGHWAAKSTVQGFSVPNDACFSLEALQLCN